jgi:hypothetical protein
VRLLVPRRAQILAGGDERAGELAAHRLEQSAGRAAYLVLDRGIGIELGVASGVGLPIADVAIESARSLSLRIARQL